MKFIKVLILAGIFLLCQGSLGHAAKQGSSDREYYKRMYDEYKTQRHLPDDYNPWDKNGSGKLKDSSRADVLPKETYQDSENFDNDVPKDSVQAKSQEIKKAPAKTSRLPSYDYMTSAYSYPQKHLLDFWAESSYVNYESDDIEQAGFMYGIGGMYKLYVSEKTPLMFDGRVSFGQFDVDSPTIGSADNIDTLIAETRVSFGYDVDISDRTRLTPYIGFGYRYLLDQSGGKVSSNGIPGADSNSQYLYLPIGIKTETVFNDGWSLGLNAEYDVFLSGTEESHLEDIDPRFNILKNEQEEGYGIRGAIRLTKDSERLKFYIEPFIRYWNIAESDYKPVIFNGTFLTLESVPENVSTEYGLKVGVNF